MSLDWILDDTNANNARVSTFFLKGSDGKIFQALWNIQSLSQLLSSATPVGKQPRIVHWIVIYMNVHKYLPKKQLRFGLWAIVCQ